MGHNTNDYLAIAVARNEPEILGQDMTPGDICRRPRTPQVHGDFRTIKVDGPVGDYLVSTLRRLLGAGQQRNAATGQTFLVRKSGQSHPRAQCR